MKRYFKYLNGAWLWVILAPVLMILEVYCDLKQPDIMSRIVDIGIKGGAGSNYILQEGIKMIVTALIGFIGGFGALLFSTKASQYFGYKLREDVFSKIQDFSFTNIDNFSSASLITRTTNDIVMLQMIVGMVLRMLVRSPMTFLGGIYNAIRINASLAVILAVSIPLIVLILMVTISKSFPLFKKVQSKLDRVNAIIQENLTGIRVVKAYDRAQHENDRFGNANNEYVKISIQAQQIMAFMMPGISIVMNISVVAVLWFGAKLVGNNAMLVGEVSAFVTYITRILGSLMMMSMMLMTFSRAQASEERISEVLDAKIDIISPSDAVDTEIKKGEIEFKNVSFRYEGALGEPVLKNISLTIKSGQKVAILGSTGSGKSTLVNLIPRLYDATEGEVLIDGINVKQYNIETLRNSIGMVLQDTILFSGTIASNLRWGKKDASDEEMKKAAQMAQAEEFINEQSEGYNAILEQRGVNFSGGQKQRLSIARAFIKNPRILILDDSTSAVDTATEAKIKKAINTETSDSTVIIIAQRISSAIDSDNIFVLENGELVAQGNHQYLLKNSSVYQEIYYSQIEKEEE